MAANYDVALAHLLELISTTRDRLERCFATLNHLLTRISEIERMQKVSDMRARATLKQYMDLEALGAIDTAGVAALLHCSRHHATSRVTKMPGFPKPIVNLSQKTRAWDRDEVLAFVKKRPRRRRCLEHKL